MEITWLGHACFKISDGERNLFIDPFISENPVCPITIDDIDDAEWILVTHGHSDHYADANSLAKQTGATLVSVFEITEDAQENGVKSVEPMNVGGSIETNGITVHMTEAQHSSGPGLGHQAGFVIEWDDNCIYHSGDTGLFSDMELIADFLNPDIGLIPIGDRFTMGPRSAAKAVDFLNVNQVIPMHYNTFDAVEQDPNEFSDRVGSDSDVIILDPGESHQLL